MPKRNMHVVIVEDNEPTAYLVEKAFRDKNDSVDWDLCFVKDGEEALDCVFQPRQAFGSGLARPGAP
jgi:CheY-like chemotaxis protein